MGPKVHLHGFTNLLTYTHESFCQLFDFYCAPVDNCPVREKGASKYQSGRGRTSRQSSSVDFSLIWEINESHSQKRPNPLSVCAVVCASTKISLEAVGLNSLSWHGNKF